MEPPPPICDQTEPVCINPPDTGFDKAIICSNSVTDDTRTTRTVLQLECVIQ